MSIFRIRSNVKNFYLDRLWSRDGDAKQRFEHFDSLLFVLSIVLLVALILPVRISLGAIFVYLLVDFGYPALIFGQWSRCVESIRRFRETIADERDWLRKIHGFQLIRPTSSLFDAQLVELRANLFLELRKQFLAARILARATGEGDDAQLISSIDLNEFGPLMSGDAAELRRTTNLFDPPAIKSLAELCRLQLDETIHLVEMRRADSFSTLLKYQSEIRSSIEKIRRAKKNCSTFVDVAPLHCRSNRLTSCYFLLRSAAERLFELNEENAKSHDDFQRIINDVRTVIFSLEALRNKSVVNEEKPLPSSSHVETSTEISVSHRFDDEPAESIDEILVGETDGEPEECSRKVCASDELDEHQQRVLREQTRSLMKELENAIESKKNEWTEREKRLFGDRPAEVEVPKVVLPPPPPSPPQIVRRVTPMSMLDELKETFSQQKQLDEETFGEDDDDESD